MVTVIVAAPSAGVQRLRHYRKSSVAVAFSRHSTRVSGAVHRALRAHHPATIAIQQDSCHADLIASLARPTIRELTTARWGRPMRCRGACSAVCTHPIREAKTERRGPFGCRTATRFMCPLVCDPPRTARMRALDERAPARHAHSVREHEAVEPNAHRIEPCGIAPKPRRARVVGW